MALPEFHSVLIINLGGMGDLLLSIPALRALKQRYSGARFDFLVSDRTPGWFAGFVLANHLYAWPGNLLAAPALLRELRRNRYDLAVNMRTMVSGISSLKMRLLAAGVAARMTCGRDTDGRGGFFDIRIPETNAGGQHEMLYDCDTARALGAEVKDMRVVLSADHAARLALSDVLVSRGGNPDLELIVVHPGGMPSRRWPLERFARLIALLREKADAACAVAVTGDSRERLLCRQLCRMAGPGVSDLSGLLSPPMLFALMEKARLVITNDTGPMHVAAMMQRPLIALFGPGDLVRYDPRVIHPRAVVFFKGRELPVCNKRNCRGRECLKRIDVDEVARAALRLLEVDL